MTVARENWSARSGFILAAIGSAVGLGNIWRFPYVAYENGGGAFLIPYLIALFTAGLPLLFLDYAIGHRNRQAAPQAYARIWQPAQALGWWQVMVCLIIAIYYAAVLMWSASYIYFSLGQVWGSDPEGFFFQQFLQNNSNTTFKAQWVAHLLWPLLLIWMLTLFILYGGIRKGVELSNRIFMPLLLVLFVVLVIQALRMPGAVQGLDAFFKPNWQAMWDYKVWLAAYGHIFFSLSVGFGIMVTYASYLKPKSDLTGSGFVVGFANSAFEILAGIGVFAALGYMAHMSAQPVSEVVSGGIGLAFIAFPKIISSLGSGATAFGMLFFGALLVAGITSLVSILQVPIAALQDKLAWSRRKAVTVVGGGCAVISVALFSSVNAITLLDIIDHFMNNIGIVLGALLSIILVAWFKPSQLQQLQQHSNHVSSIQLGRAWVFCLKVLTPLVLLVILSLALRNLLMNGYGGYAPKLVWLFGWGSVALCLLGAWAMTRRNSKKQGDAS